MEESNHSHSCSIDTRKAGDNKDKATITGICADPCVRLQQILASSRFYWIVGSVSAAQAVAHT